MSDHLIERALQLVENALELQGEERSRFVEQACGDDADLLREVQTLLEPQGEIEISDAGPAARASDPKSYGDKSSRYRLGDEVARGATGAILRAHDKVLDREVAVKVLLGMHQDNRDITSRFVAEAHIGARLQHPGVAPVYDLATLPDGRPFFALKLVRGETLSVLLRRRQNPLEDLPRVLTVFEQICQTTAYAHSLGVIHRDLKPDNIMVGEFGEVQVMDWGLAKIVDQEDAPASSEVQLVRHDLEWAGLETRLGVVMGTPAYMPPEQVAGRAGTSTDVFALGAVLCEILTGAPPYTGKTPLEVVGKSVGGAVEEGLARLEVCGADRALVDLARRCLDPVADRRPADAGELAREVGAYLKDLEQRVQRAELATQHARAMAEEERRRRRVSRALGASLLAVVILVLGAWVWIARQGQVHAEAVADMRAKREAAAEAQTCRALMRVGAREAEAENWREVRRLLEQVPPRYRNWEWHHLRRQIHQYRRTFGADGEQYGMAGFASDGKAVVGIDLDGRSCWWDLDSGHVLGSHPGYGPAIAMGPEGQLILTSGESPLLWNAITGEIVRRFPEVPKSWKKGAIARGGRHVTIGLANGSRVKLLETATGRELAELTGAKPWAHFSADGKWLAWISKDREVSFWNVEVGREARPPVAAHAKILGKIALSDDGRWVAASCGSSIALWDLVDGGRREIPVRYSSSPWGPELVFDARGRLISIDSHDSVRVIDPVDGTLLLAIPHNPQKTGILGPANVRGELCLTTPSDLVRLWDLSGANQTVLRGHESYVYPVAVHRDDRRIASGSWDKTIRIWDADSGAELLAFEAHEIRVVDLAFDPRGGRVVSAGASNGLRVFNADSGEAIGSAETKGWPKSLAFSPDGSRLVVGTNELEIFDGTSLELVASLPVEKPLKVGFSADGKLFAAMERNAVTTFDATSLEPIATWRSTDRLGSLAVSPSGVHVAVGDAAGQITVLDAQTMEAAGEPMTGHAGEVFALVYLADGTRLFSGASDATVRVWDTARRDEVTALRGHESYIYSLALASDGGFLVSGSGDGTVRIWDARPPGQH